MQKHHRTQSQVLILAMVFVLGHFHYHATLGVWLLFALLALHGFALRYSRPDNLAAVALLIPLIEVQLASLVLWPLGWGARALVSIWMLITLLLVIGLATWLHARWTRRRLRIDRQRFENSAETGVGLWSRARLMLALGLVFIPLGLGLQQLALFASQRATDSADVRIAGLNEGDAAVDSDAAGASDSGDGEATAVRKLKREMVLPSTIDWQGKAIQSNKEEVVFHLISDHDRGREEGSPPYFSTARPLYLMATTYDQLGPAGLSRGPGSEVIRHSDDGVGSDDWIIFDEDLVNHPITRFEIRQRLLFNDAEGIKGTRGYLLHDRRLVALRMPNCRLDIEDGTALGELKSGDLLSYQWWSQPVPQNVPLMPAAGAKSRYLDLPSGFEFQDWILEAREVGADQMTAEGKLEAIVDHFKDNFTYDLEPSEADGIEAFDDFFSNRKGYCSYFASAGLLFLRANGIPCRVASGFVVSEYSEEVHAYVGRLSNAHAWVEVQQQDGSWRTVDPTPAASRNSLLAALRSQQQSDQLLADESRGVESEESKRAEEVTNTDDQSYWGIEFIGMVLAGLLPLLTSILILGSVLMRLRNKRSQRRSHTELTPEAKFAMDYWGRIQELLNQLGFSSRRSQSAAEFSAHVQLWGGEFYRPLNNVITLVYRSRFGGYAWTERQQQYLDQYEELLERKLRQDG